MGERTRRTGLRGASFTVAGAFGAQLLLGKDGLTSGYDASVRNCEPFPRLESIADGPRRGTGLVHKLRRRTLQLPMKEMEVRLLFADSFRFPICTLRLPEKDPGLRSPVLFMKANSGFMEIIPTF